MERTPSPLSTDPHPLSCPRCGCQESRVVRSRRMTQGAKPEPLPGILRTRVCEFCGRQFRTREQLEEISLRSDAWRARIGQRTIPLEGVPQGEHPGLWTMNTASIAVGDVTYEIDTRNEMRAEKYPCRVIVTERGITVESGEDHHADG